jgi:very-short-patch-repair endonuclease
MTTETHPVRRRQQVERAAAEWRNALIDVSGTNRLLYFRPTTATLDLSPAAPGAVAELLAGTSVRLSRLFPEPVTRVAALRSCKSLAAKEREATEEYGVSVAFLAVGLATWQRSPQALVDIETGMDPGAGEPDGSATDALGRSGRAPTPPSAPVLLRSVTVAGRPGSDVWELTLTGEYQLNPVLQHVLSYEGVILDEDQAQDLAGEDLAHPEAVFDYVHKACDQVPGFRIEQQMLLGAFSYLKQPMVADVEDIDALLSSDLVAALAGDKDAAAMVCTQVGDVSDADPDYRPVESEHLVLDADASQCFVVNAALAGRTLVVQGPPGTGKSQTIANVIAGLVADGKRVLFVAQKRAAITAVLDRLEAVGLGDLTLDLFAAGASRRYVADRLREVLERQATALPAQTVDLHRALAASRDRLVAHRDAMHTRPRAWGDSTAQLLEQTYDLPRDMTTLRLPTATLDAWAPGDLTRHAAAFGELAAKGGLDPQRLTRPGWSVAALTTADAVGAANAALDALRGEQLLVAADALGALAREVGAPEPLNPTEIRRLLDTTSDADAVAQAAPGALSPDLDDDGLERLLAATDKTYRKTHGPKLGWGERRRARREAHALVRDDLGTDQLHQLLLRAKDVRHAWTGLGASGAPRPAGTLTAAKTSHAALTAGLDALAPWLQNLELTTQPLPELAQALDRLAGDHTRAWLPRLHELEAGLTQAGCGPLLAAARRYAGTDPALAAMDEDRAGELLRYVAVHSALEHALTTDPDLAATTGSDLDRATGEFRRLDREHLDANAVRVRRAAATRLVRTLDAHPDQHRLLMSEITRRRNFRAVRRLFDEAPDVMTAVKPCWAMSPLQVSRLLPARACFDVVIFDEASQVKPADAVPALIRAPQALVAGDSRQLPPTEFFTKVLDGTPPPPAGPAGAPPAVEEDALEEDDDVDLTNTLPVAAAVAVAREPRATLTEDKESILAAFDTLLAGQSRQLLWHYRSRDERLIATSNAYVYDWSLTTFPAADGHACLRHEEVPPSVGIGGKTNSPEAEVRRVVELVLEHARRDPTRSLGVITLGIPHARRIEAALDAALAAEPDLEAALDANEREPFFVKNIERVQGDERDTIILSVGYGKGLDGRLRKFWGPLLKPGGERRLNVAISRARAEMTLVTSFAADDLAEDGHPSPGYQLMYRFARFAAFGELPGGHRRHVGLNPFELDVRDRLTAAGLELDPQLGVGAYRLDFAVRHPTHPGRYVLAIEADGANYHSGHIARERDRLRQKALEERGWRFHRIWSTDWFNDCDREIAAAVAAYQAALHDDTAPDPVDDDAQTDPEPTDDDPSWHVAAAERTTPRPWLVPGLAIHEYTHRQLVDLVRHIRSDGIPRTRDQELGLLMRELGFTRRGHRIVAALTAAQTAVG